MRCARMSRQSTDLDYLGIHGRCASGGPTVKTLITECPRRPRAPSPAKLQLSTWTLPAHSALASLALCRAPLREGLGMAAWPGAIDLCTPSHSPAQRNAAQRSRAQRSLTPPPAGPQSPGLPRHHGPRAPRPARSPPPPPGPWAPGRSAAPSDPPAPRLLCARASGRSRPRPASPAGSRRCTTGWGGAGRGGGIGGSVNVSRPCHC
jgi:hypothetical protein